MKKKNTLLKKTAMLTLAVLFATSVAGCGSEAPVVSEAPAAESGPEVAIRSDFTEDDLKDVVTGIEDHYVQEGAKDID